MTLPKYQQAIKLGLTMHGRMFYLLSDQYVGGSLDKFGAYSQSETNFLRLILQPDWVCIDGGANHGVFTLEMARRSAKVISVEPQPLMAELIMANVAINELSHKVIMYHGGLGAENTMIKIPMMNYNELNNYGAYSLDMEAPNEHKFPIPITTIDKLTEGLKVDFIKLDIEGMELDALRGAAHVIEKCRPVMLIECDKEDSGPAVLEYIDQLDYDMYWLRTLLWQDKNPFGCSWEDNPFGAQASFNLYCVPRGGQAIEGLPRAYVGDRPGFCETSVVTVVDDA